MADDERAWVDGLRRGDRAAFDAVFAAYRRRIYAYLVRMTRRKDAAEDLLQDHADLRDWRAVIGVDHSGRNVQQLRCLSTRERDSQLGKHRNVGASKAVDRLLAIAHDDQAVRRDVARARQRARFSRAGAFGALAQQEQELTLHAARVLKFVDQE